MVILDDSKLYEKHDPLEMRARIAEFPDQIEKAAQTFKAITIPAHYVQARNMLILGMGGSAIGGELAAALAFETNPIPVEVRRDYTIPGYVNKDTMVIGVSYSGNTEETLTAFRQAAAKGAKLLVVTKGGDIASLGRKFQVPIFQIEYDSTPREAMGYLFTAVIMIMQKMRLYPMEISELFETAVLLRALSSKLEPTVPQSENLAKSLAFKLREKIPVIIGSGPMGVVARRWKTQINENAKLPAIYDTIPELCHNTIVGMERVWKQRDVLAPIFLQSSGAHPRNQLRTNIVSKIFSNLRLPVETIVMHPTGTPLSEALQTVLLGDYVSYYLAISAGISPTPIAPIENLKKQLAEHPLTA